MEKYIKPEVEIENYEQVDILTKSGSNSGSGSNTNYNPSGNDFTTPIIP